MDCGKDGNGGLKLTNIYDQIDYKNLKNLFESMGETSKKCPKSNYHLSMGAPNRRNGMAPFLAFPPPLQCSLPPLQRMDLPPFAAFLSAPPGTNCPPRPNRGLNGDLKEINYLNIYNVNSSLPFGSRSQGDQQK
jgi:hypothetical protein